MFSMYRFGDHVGQVLGGGRGIVLSPNVQLVGLFRNRNIAWGGSFVSASTLKPLRLHAAEQIRRMRSQT